MCSKPFSSIIYRLIGDSDDQKFIDRMKCIAFREARDSVAHFIIRKWFAKKLNKSVRSVSDNWNKSEEECHSDFRKCGPPFKLSQ